MHCGQFNHLGGFQLVLHSPPQVNYKKGHDERKAKYTSLADPPEMELAKKANQQRSDVSTPVLNWISNTLFQCNDVANAEG